MAEGHTSNGTRGRFVIFNAYFKNGVLLPAYFRHSIYKNSMWIPKISIHIVHAVKQQGANRKFGPIIKHVN